MKPEINMILAFQRSGFFVKKVLRHISARKLLRKVLLVTIVLFAFWFLLRAPIARFVVHKMTARLSLSSGMEISVRDVGFHGFKTLVLEGIQVVDSSHGFPGIADTLVNLETCQANPSLLNLFAGKLRLNSLRLENGYVVLQAKLLWIWLKQHKASVDTGSIAVQPVSFAGAIWEVQNKLFRTIPAKIEFSNLSFEYRKDSLFSIVRCNSLLYRRRKIEGDFIFADNSTFRSCRMKGMLDKGNNLLNLTFTGKQGEGMLLPYLGPRWNASIGFDTARLEMSFSRVKTDSINITGRAAAKGLTFYHKLLSPDTLLFSDLSIDFGVGAGSSSIAFDSATHIFFNGFDFSPVIAYQHFPCKKISLGIREKDFEAASFFSAIPSGLLPNFKNIKVDGGLTYSLDLEVPLLCPDSAHFQSMLESHNFRITHNGVTDFSMLNAPFQHEVYENGMLVASFQVGGDNPDFVPLNEISPLLVSSVLTSEDGAFYFHRGFNEEAFRESLTENIREKRFARGGSTISMQLVKNVFLTRRKTIARKAEEALIVWIIENQRLVTKDRMLEVYLNIIEWGPGIYGIGQASRFYFNKKPSQLSLQECLFLSSIVPRPRAFKYSFVQNGQLKPYLAEYFRIMQDHLLRQGRISESDTAGLNTRVFLKGEALRFLKTQDTLQLDTIPVFPGIGWD
ncbi:MAG: biosynthetic peptidoglycan transglycosylase [Bacteroidales bacterium]